MNTINCKKDGRPLGWKLDGGVCVCPPDECRDPPKRTPLPEIKWRQPYPG